MTLEDKAGELLVHSAGTLLTIDKQSGLIRSWQSNGDNLIVSGPILNLGEQRRYQGEHSNKLPCLQSREAPLLKNVSVTSSPTNNAQAALITVAGDVYLVESAERQGRLVYTLVVQPNAQINVNWKLTWQAADHAAFELGMKMLAPAAMNTLSWSREGQWTGIRRIYWRGGGPRQQHGSLVPVRQTGCALGVAGRGRTFRAGRVERRFAAAHARVVRGRGHDFFLSSAVAPPRDFSTGLLEAYQITLVKGGSLGRRLQAAVHARRALAGGYK